jgi:hypothetical protein
MLGDSVTVQFANFLSSDLWRSGFSIRAVKNTLNAYNNQKEGGGDVVSSRNGKGNVTIYSFVGCQAEHLSVI